MIGLKEAEKDLKNLADKSKADIEKARIANMSPEERKKHDAEQKTAEDKRKATEAQAKRDKEILEASDEDIKSDKFTDVERTRKQELLDEKKKKEDAKISPEVLKIKEETQKRIDTIQNNLLQLKDTSSKEAEELRRQLKVVQDEKDALEKKLTVPSADDETESILDEEEQKRITKYLEDDKDKPREKRREITDEELDDWLAEELGKAQAWLSKREVRRDKDREKDRFTKGQEKYVKNLTDKQGESKDRAWAKHPELDISKREKELKDEGKSVEEVNKILRQENEKHRICLDLLAKNPNKYLYADNGPELIISDMEKELGKPAETDEKQKQIDDLTKQVEELTALVQEFRGSDEGFSSTRKKKPPEGEDSAEIKQFIKTSREMKLPQARIDIKVKEMRAAGK